MKIPVIDNPYKSNGARRKVMKRKRKASPAQLRARAAFSAKAKSGAFRRKAKASRPARKTRKAAKARKSMSIGKHRPVVIRKKSGLHRPRRSSIPSRASFKNPFLGGLITMGNPRKKHRKSGHRKHRRSSRRGLSVFRNPLGGAISGAIAGPREMMKKDFVTEAANVAVGFVLPGIVMTYLPVSMRNAPWKGYASKVVVVGVLAGAANMVSKRASRAILLGGGVSLLLDLYTDYVHPMIVGASAPSAPGGAAAFWGGPNDPGGMGAFWGNNGAPGSGLSDGADIGEAFA